MNTPMKYPTISALLTENARHYGDRVVFRVLDNGHDESDVISHAGLELDCQAIAARLQRVARRGDRAIILSADSAHFIRAFMACQLAGVIAVPVAPPVPLRNARRADTLRAIARDCAARVVLSSSGTALREPVRAFAPELAELEWIDVDTVGQEERAGYVAPRVEPEDVSFLQYTSGSTSTPKGVMVSHRALLRNEEIFTASMEITSDDVIVSWLPLFHDMGLIGNVLQAAYAGAELVLMQPQAFVQRPSRWLRAITKYRGTVAGAPNFAFELCVQYIPEQDRSEFELSSWKVAFSGAEPVRPATLDAFARAYQPHGFDRKALYPAYGLAEATLIASGGRRGQGPVTIEVDREALGKGEVVPGGDHTIISVGTGRLSREILIVDPDTRVPRDHGVVGEIWLAGADIPLGYWGRPAETELTFGARRADTGSGPYLRTGDLGVWYEGELYVVGRLKDIIIVGGRNHYPQDIEATAEAAHPWVRSGFTAALSAEGAGRERLVLLAEVRRPPGSWRAAGPGGHQAPPALEEIRRSVRAAVADVHGVQVDEVLLIRPGSLPKTSSGKIQRRACAAAYQNGEFTPATQPGGAARNGAA